MPRKHDLSLHKLKHYRSKKRHNLRPLRNQCVRVTRFKYDLSQSLAEYLSKIGKFCSRWNFFTQQKSLGERLTHHFTAHWVPGQRMWNKITLREKVCFYEIEDSKRIFKNVEKLGIRGELISCVFFECFRASKSSCKLLKDCLNSPEVLNVSLCSVFTLSGDPRLTFQSQRAIQMWKGSSRSWLDSFESEDGPLDDILPCAGAVVEAMGHCMRFMDC